MNDTGERLQDRQVGTKTGRGEGQSGDEIVTGEALGTLWEPRSQKVPRGFSVFWYHWIPPVKASFRWVGGSAGNR